MHDQAGDPKASRCTLAGVECFHPARANQKWAAHFGGQRSSSVHECTSCCLPQLHSPQTLPFPFFSRYPEYGSMEASAGNGDNFEHATETFVNWFRRRPGATISPKIRLADLRQSNAGRGVGTVPFSFDPLCTYSDR